MMLRRTALAALACIWTPPGTLAADRKKRSAQEEKVKDLNDLSERLNRLASDAEALEEQKFLHARISELMDQAREAPAGSYLFDRLESAIDDLLDASGELRESREDRPGEDKEDDAQEDTARDLERTYFRVKQGDYFARQSRDPWRNDYVKLAQSLYQQARAQYDGGKYWRSRRLAEAAREVIDGLESLAQAAVRIPEPPRL